MVSRMPVKGEDYIVDYYALLGLPRDASVADVKSARNEMVKRYHPDRISNMAPELVAIAEKQTTLLSELSETLLQGSDKKTAYDTQLENWEGAISKDGTPIIDLSKPGFSMHTLAHNALRSPEQQAKEDEELEKMIRMMSGFNQASFDMMVKMAESDEGIPDHLREAYGEQLANRDCYLSLLESFTWQGMGEHNKHDDKPSLAHTHQITQDIAAYSEKAKVSVQEQVLLLTAGQVSLLPPPESGIEAVGGTDVVLRGYQAHFDKFIADRSRRISGYAKERGELLEKRFLVQANPRYAEGCEVPKDRLIIDLVHEMQSLRFAMQYEANSVSVIERLSGPISGPASDEEVAAFIAEGFSCMTVNFLTDVDIHSQLTAVTARHSLYLDQGSFDTVSETLGDIVSNTDVNVIPSEDEAIEE